MIFNSGHFYALQLGFIEYRHMVQIYTPDKLNDLMASSDYVVAALPHTDKTEKLVNAEAISNMKKTGVFVNIGRGQTVDEEALIRGEKLTDFTCLLLCLHY